MSMLNPLNPPSVPQSGFPYSVGLYSQATPFTVRDGLTYLLQLEGLTEWVLETLTPHVDGTFETLITEFNRILGEITAVTKEDREAFEAIIRETMEDASNLIQLADASAKLAEYWSGQTKAIQLDLIKESPSGQAKMVEGGFYPKPQRFPTLTTVDSWPNARGQHTSRILWVENNGLTLYAYGSDQQLRKSLDGGASWIPLAYLNWAPAPNNVFVKLPTGSLITATYFDRSIRRSTDDGKTWTIAGQMQPGQEALGTQAFAYDPIRKFLYMGMYGGVNQTEMHLLRSADDGATWGVIHRFPGTLTDSPDRIVHIHTVQYDPYMQRVVISVGDSTPATGLYRTTETGNGVEPLLLNRMLPESFVDAPRTIGIMPFPDYLAWASDSTANSYVFRMARSEIGKDNPVVERVYRLNSTAWWSCRASDDGSRWVITASQENVGHSLDRLTHLYAIEDQGKTIYEIGALAPITVNSVSSSLMPVGLAEIHGETFFMSTRGTGGAGATWKFRLGLGAGAAIQWPPRLPEVVTYKTIGTGPTIPLPANGSVALGYDSIPSQAPCIYIHDAMITTIGGGVGNTVVGIRNRTTGEVLYSTALSNTRAAAHLENGGSIARVDGVAGTALEVFVSSTHGAATTVNASITYGFGLRPSA